jgi:Transglycosylase SLT domain
MRAPRTFWATCVITIIAMTALPCLAGEVAVLKNGFTIQHERREIVGELTRLYVTADGASYVDVPTADIDHFEIDEAPPAPRPVSARENAGFNSPIPFPVRPTTDLNTVVNEASGKYRLDPDLVNSVIKAESEFKVHAISPKGAQGLMQLMPGTAAQLGVRNTFDPRDNVDGGTRYLRELLERYNFDLVKALAAYNAGPQRVEHFGGVPPYQETRAYVAKIVKDFNKKKEAQQKAVAAKKCAPVKTSAGKGTPGAKPPTRSVAQAKATGASE